MLLNKDHPANQGNFLGSSVKAELFFYVCLKTRARANANAYIISMRSVLGASNVPARSGAPVLFVARGHPLIFSSVRHGARYSPFCPWRERMNKQRENSEENSVGRGRRVAPTEQGLGKDRPASGSDGTGGAWSVGWIRLRWRRG